MAEEDAMSSVFQSWKINI